MLSLNKKIVPVFIYWVILFLFLKFFAPIFIKDGGWVLLFLIVFPFLFLILYKLSRLENLKEKMYFVLFGFVIPFIIIYYYLFLDFQKNFNPSF